MTSAVGVFVVIVPTSVGVSAVGFSAQVDGMVVIASAKTAAATRGFIPVLSPLLSLRTPVVCLLAEPGGPGKP